MGADLKRPNAIARDTVYVAYLLPPRAAELRESSGFPSLAHSFSRELNLAFAHLQQLGATLDKRVDLIVETSGAFFMQGWPYTRGGGPAGGWTLRAWFPFKKATSYRKASKKPHPLMGHEHRQQTQQHHHGEDRYVRTSDLKNGKS